MNTKISYVYTDTSNNKAYNEVIVKGKITEDQINCIKESLDIDNQFVPDLIGLPNVKPTDNIKPDNHCSCELTVNCFELTEEKETEEIDCEELVQRFEEGSKDLWLEPELISIRDKARFNEACELISHCMEGINSENQIIVRVSWLEEAETLLQDNEIDYDCTSDYLLQKNVLGSILKTSISNMSTMQLSICSNWIPSRK